MPQTELNFWHWFFKTLNSAIRRINIRETNVVFHRVEIYPVDSVIRLLNNWGLVKSVCETPLKSLSNPNRISERAMIGLLKNPLLICQSGWSEIRNVFPVIRWVCGRHRTRIAAPLPRRYQPGLDYVCNTGYFITTIGCMMDTRLTCSPIGLNNL